MDVKLNTCRYPFNFSVVETQINDLVFVFMFTLELPLTCIHFVYFFLLLSAFLRNCFLCWDHWNGDVMPTLDAALLGSSRVGSDLGRESRMVEELLITHVCGSRGHRTCL